MLLCFRSSASALIMLGAVATSQPSWAQALAGRPDRYGLAYAASPAAARASAGAAALRIRYLTWPGKVMPTAPVLRAELTAPSQPSLEDSAWRRPPSRAVDMRAPARFATAQPPLWNPRPVVSSAPRPAWVRPPQAEAPARRVADVHTRPAPESIYDVPEPMGRDPVDQPSASTASPMLRGRREPSPQAPAQTQTSSVPLQTQQTAFATPPRVRPANGEGVRFYSVHRPFGMRPDPAPIPPQFFAATPDLSDPPGPITNRRVAAGAGLAARGAVQAQDGDSTAQP